MKRAALALITSLFCAGAHAGDLVSAFILEPAPHAASFALELSAPDAALASAATRLVRREALAAGGSTPQAGANADVVLSATVEKTRSGVRLDARIATSRGGTPRLQLSVLGRPQPGFGVTLPDVLPEFSPVLLDARDLHGGRAITRTAAALHTAPSSSSRRHSRVPSGRVFQIVQRRDGWMQVLGPRNRPYWLEESRVETTPCRVGVDWNRTLPRSYPGGRALPRPRISHRSHRVIDARAVGKALWYRLEGVGGWIRERDALSRSCLPAADFAAALSRWQRGDYAAAVAAWKLYLDSADPVADRATLAQAHVWSAAGELLNGAPAEALEHLGRATDLAPDDAATYRLRALVRAVVERKPEGAHADLSRALELAPADRETRRLLEAFAALHDRHDHRYDLLRYLIRPTPQAREALDRLRDAATPG